MDKNKGFFVFDLQYKSVAAFYCSIVAIIVISSINFATFCFQFYQIIDTEFKQSLNLPFANIFYVLTGILVLFVGLSVLTYCKGFCTNLWSYFLLFLQAIGLVFIEVGVSCFESSNGWCNDDFKFKIGSALMVIIYALVIIGLRLLFYYPFYDDQHILSMKENFSVLFVFLYKVLLCLIVNFHPGQSQLQSQGQAKYPFLETQLILVLSLLIFILTRKASYCYPLVAKIWQILYKFLLWTSIVLFVLPNLSGQVTQSRNQNLFWYVWGYSIPFVAAFAFLYRSNNISWQHFFLNKKHCITDQDTLFLQCSQLKNQLNYLKKSELKANDPKFKELWSLVVTHNEFCEQIHCPLKNIKSLKIDRADEFLEQKRLNKTIQACFEFGKFYLDQQLNESPNSLDLIIQIAHYDFDALHNKQNGLIVFNMHYGRSQISLSQKYALYYLKKKIDSLYQQNEMQSNNNAQAELSEFRHNIEVSVSMLAEFWYFLADPKCNLKKLYDLANILFPLKIGVDSDWQKIEKMKNIQSHNLYARYLIKMFNDKQKGLRILQQAAKIEHQLRNQQQVQVGLQGGTNALVQQNGIIFLQFDGVNSGVMFQVNLGAQRIFGYNKGELVERKVNDIMPKVYAKHHDKILEHYQQTNKSRMMNKERHIVGRGKNGYLFPFTILIKPVRNFYSQTAEVYASLRRQLWVKQLGIITLDQDENVSQFSASVLSIFPGLTNKNINGGNLNKKKIHIQQILAEYPQIRETCLNNKETYEYCVKRSFQIGMKNKQHLEQPSIFNITVQPINISISDKPIGYIIKLNRSINTTNFSQMRSITTSVKKTIKQLFSQNFRFTYQINGINQQKSHQNQTQIIRSGKKFKQPNTGSHVVNYIGGRIIKDSFIDDLLKKSSNHFSIINSLLSSNQKQAQRFDYSVGVKTKRLVKNSLKQIHPQSQNSQFQNNFQAGENEENAQEGAIRPSELNSILQKQSSNASISLLRLMTLVLILGSTCSCIAQYVSIKNSNEQFMQNVYKKRKFNQLLSEVLYMKTFVTFFSQIPKNQSLSDQFDAQINSLDSYLDFHKFQNNILVKYSDGKSQQLFLSFALNKLVSEVNSLKTLTNTFKIQNSHVFFVVYNTINSIVQGLNIEINHLSDQYNQITQSYFFTNVIYISVVGIFSLVCLIIKVIALKTVIKKKTQILEVFFEIPRKSCSNIQKECQKFIQKLSSQDEQIDMQSVYSQNSQAQNAQSRTAKQKKRTVMGQQKTTTNYYIAVFSLLIFFMSFHSYVLLSNYLTKDAVQYSQYSKTTLFALEPSFSLQANLINSFVQNPQIPILNEISHRPVISNSFSNLTQLINQASMIYFNALNIYDDLFQQQFNSLFYGNLCLNKTVCLSQFGENKGLNSIVFRYFDQIQIKYQKLRSTLLDGTISSDERGYLLSPNTLEAQSKFVESLENLQFLIKQYWRGVLFEYIKQLKKKNFEESIFIGLVLTLGIINFTLILIGWLKYYQVLQQKILATQYILTFIPINQINKNSKIAQFIKKQVLGRRE